MNSSTYAASATSLLASAGVDVEEPKIVFATSVPAETPDSTAPFRVAVAI